MVWGLRGWRVCLLTWFERGDKVEHEIRVCLAPRALDDPPLPLANRMRDQHIPNHCHAAAAITATAHASQTRQGSCGHVTDPPAARRRPERGAASEQREVVWHRQQRIILARVEARTYADDEVRTIRLL